MKKFLGFLKDLLEVVIVSLIIVFVCFKYVFISAEVIGKSMETTLFEGQRGYSFKITKSMGIERFDICVIETDKTDELLVKRVIGLPNETIEYRNNKLYINDVLYKESFLDDANTEDFKVTLGSNEYYCLGDNRDISRDSRYYGPFSSEEIVSTHFFIYYPFDNFGFKK